MNFFEEQARAKQKTIKLLFLFPLAILGLSLFLYLGLFLISIFLEDPGYISGFHLNFIYILTTIIIVVMSGSFYKIQELRAGGSVVAEALGGWLVSSQTAGVKEQQLRNIVEEMAIASSLPVPSIYVLEEPSINAFAAGLTPSDAAIGVTRGAITRLSRDELQGVVAHEFSHILYGDMRLNTRLVGILHGILIISLTGEQILYSIQHVDSYSDENSDKSSKPRLALMLFGFILLVCGYIGVFVANLIKNAVNHQREFLADASAVQFTRHPEGIAGALKKIGGLKHKTLDSNRASEFNHMYFTQGVSPFMESYKSTHPPLEERISRLEPHWDRKFIKMTISDISPNSSTLEGSSETSSHVFVGLAGSDVPDVPSSAPRDYPASSVEEAIQFVGAPQKRHISTAQVMLQSLPEPLKKAGGTPENAQILVYRFLLHSRKDQRDKQLQLLQSRLSPQEMDTLKELIRLVPVLNTKFRLPLLNLAIPALKECSTDQIKSFLENLHLLSASDQNISLMEWCLIRILKSSLSPTESGKNQYQLTDLPDDIGIILSALAYTGEQNEEQVQNAFAHASKTLPSELELKVTKENSLKDINDALNRLKELLPLQKPLLLKAMAKCVSFDNRTTAAEAELLRAVAGTLGCPMPPLLAPMTATLSL